LAAADYPVWSKLELEPFTWDNFQSIFGHETPPKPNWPEVGLDIPAHHHTKMNNFKWDMG
jgi:hypothetical protein